MGILDQLFDVIDSNTRDPAIAPVDTQLSQSDWVVATTSYAAHQGMRNGFGVNNGKTFSNDSISGGNLGTDFTSDVLSTPRPEYGVQGTVSVAKTFEMLDSWEKIIVAQQLRDVRYRPTAEDFADGGMKAGSKIVIEVVKESSGFDDSPFNILQSTLTTKTIGGQVSSLLFDKFSVISYTEPDEARFQIHETFGAEIIQSFGRRPRIMMISGNVLNGKARARVNGEVRSMDWKNAFQRFYENYASLHRNVMARDKVRIYAQDTVYDGYLLNMVSNTTAETQSLSQVTISFIVSKKYQPKANDEAIPGYSNKDTGFRISSASTPDDIFPQEAIEFHFSGDVTNIIKHAEDQAKTDLNELAVKINNLDSRLGQAELAINWIEGVQGKDGSSDYFTAALGFRLHKVLTGGEIEFAVISHVSENSTLLQEITSLNQQMGLPTTGNSGISAEIGTSDFVKLEADELRGQQSILRNVQNGLKRLTEEANGLAYEYSKTAQYIDHLNELKLSGSEN